MFDLGLSDEILMSGVGEDCASHCTAIDTLSDSVCMGSEMSDFCDVGSKLGFIPEEIDLPDSDNSTSPVQEIVHIESEESDVELDSLFYEDASANQTLLPEVLKYQKKEKMAQPSGGHILEKMDGIWKKGEPPKIPKAILQQLCQKLGWGAPKFTKFPATEGFSYSVSILRRASGRGKTKKAGGLITLQLPDPNDTFVSAEDSQNSVAAFTLYRLFTEYPVNQLITEPYSSYVLQWMEGLNDFQVAESTRLRREHYNRRGTHKYKEMLDARAALPIAELRSNLLGLLKENDVLVVCGETGCGKTTQVPQFILDDMIEAGLGGYCNIICTQPRRIAAISVAERVADERCEPPPGSVGSLVGYQVRLDSARNERTKLLFCTTGILLRKLAGDKNLADITHVIVDEVHERSLLGDFLLVILKNLIEKQSAQNTRKLKVILMSATVDSSLFSKYFGNCPVLTAQGRTHPVSSYFLEDIYESLEYCLASDSPASFKHIAPTKEKLRSSTVDNHRGKKNLVLSSWGDD